MSSAAQKNDAITVSQQDAQHPAIETDLIRKAEIKKQIMMKRKNAGGEKRFSRERESASLFGGGGRLLCIFAPAGALLLVILASCKPKGK